MATQDGSAAGRHGIIAFAVALGALMLAGIVLYVSLVLRPTPEPHLLRVDRDEILTVYTVDPQTMERGVSHYVYVPGDYDVAEKLAALAESLSRYQFHGLPIRILALESLEGDRIAVIDLGESDEVSDPRRSWKAGYFQGSTGGQVTTVTLRDTFLQRGYPGRWVDGVVFYYQERPMAEWDHVSLSGVFFRDETNREQE